MIVISPSELRSNLKKYLDLAKTERIVIQRGKTEMFELRRRERISEDPFFDNQENIEAIERGIKEIKEGKYKTLDPSKTLWENIL
jgi:hypothetical protein